VPEEDFLAVDFFPEVVLLVVVFFFGVVVEAASEARGARAMTAESAIVARRSKEDFRFIEMTADSVE
jgi:hypothetical protein